ncbi:hypothetical protein GH714_025067 [Hevea brasiliensis]|uniref:APO domain-containing protein n=1 Tax=Hevea brasiliensis TaxID=3981 RepID=A0A6A6MCX1_HEVBR|nr:hypothetical protein GH714_025067 [Hevea brasiliensis]
MKLLIQRAKQEKEARRAQPCRMLEHPPDNGLLVPELVEVAHQVYRARKSLLSGLAKLVKVIPVQRCRFCNEVHIGHVGHEIRTCVGPGSGSRSATHVWRRGGVRDVVFFPKCFHLYDRVVTTNFELEKNTDISDESNDRPAERDLSIGTMESWFEMISGAKKIMDKYSVLTCGYCPEVQVGPKGHKVRMCKATKHQSRDGQHAWQEATIEDLVGPNYVWHVRDLNGPSLDNKLKRYYGKAPAVVELCVQTGTPVPDQCRSMMRLDVIPPNRDEVDLVA